MGIPVNQAVNHSAILILASELTTVDMIDSGHALKQKMILIRIIYLVDTFYVPGTELGMFSTFLYFNHHNNLR